jgi:phosphotriesterase-related protein
MKTLHTTLGPKRADELGIILPHEHLFVDLRTPDAPNHGQANPADVVALMAPQIEAIKAQGVTALVECTPEGVGRNVAAIKAVSDATQFAVVVPTGIYREPWVPEWARDASEDALHDWLLRDLIDSIGKTGVRAAWIKLSAGDDGITPLEAKILRAAARAAKATGAVIGSHTIRGRVVRDQLDIIEAAGYTASRFIWIHASADELDLNLEMAQRGAWIEYDWIGMQGPNAQPDSLFIERLQHMIQAGFLKQLLISMDRGWFDPVKSGGGTPNPFTYLMDRFVPQLRMAGFSDETITTLIQHNPFAAFGR